jgi:hypothetical protein
MPQNRPAIPRELDRRVRVEAGHRCAILTCRAFPIEIAHITPWRDTQKHEFANLIALCPNCHTLYDNGQIDRQAMLQHKLNLSPLSPFMMTLHPDHIRILADYKEWRDRAEDYILLLSRFLTLRAANRVDPSPGKKVTCKDLWNKLGPASTELGMASIHLARSAGKAVSVLSDEVTYAIYRWTYVSLGRPLPADLPVTRSAPKDLPSMWMDLDHAIHLELNMVPAQKADRLCGLGD